MSDQVPRGIFALSIVAGICWIARLLRRQIWEVVELFGGIDRLIVGIFLATGIDYFGEVLVAIVAFRLLWMALRAVRSSAQVEQRIQIAILAGLVFLILTPLDSSLFYFIVPQPDSRPVTVLLYVGRNVSVALLIGSVIFPRIISKFSPSS